MGRDIRLESRIDSFDILWQERGGGGLHSLHLLEVKSQDEYELVKDDVERVIVVDGVNLDVDGKAVVRVIGECDVVVSGESIVYAENDGSVYVHDKAIVKACGESDVIAYDESMVRVTNRHNVRGHGGSFIHVFSGDADNVDVNVELDENSVVVAEGGHVTARGRAVVYATKRAHVGAYGSVSVLAFDDVYAAAYYDVDVEARGRSYVIVCNGANVRAYGRSFVRAYGTAHVRLHDFAILDVCSDEVKVLDAGRHVTCLRPEWKVKEPYRVWKKLSGGCIADLEVPRGAVVQCVDGKKARTNKVKVVGIRDVDGNPVQMCESLYDADFCYRVGEVVKADFNPVLYACTRGIHFYMSYEEALAHD